MLLSRTRCCVRPTSLHVQQYSTSKQLPKNAAGAFTSNKHIAQTVNAGDATLNKTLVYIGPFAETMQRYKMVASLFGACGLCAVPALLSTGQAPALSVLFAGASAVAPAVFIHWYTRDLVTRLMVYDDVKTVERQRRRPREITGGKWIGIETCSALGRPREDTMWLSDLRPMAVSNNSAKTVNWRFKNRRFALERAVVEADPFLLGLDKVVQNNNKL
ncbi:hypothetical protein BX666DRAFT_1886787 [Dichotomocladium elegans]|nr:hypothetical protein BX666DRAFT_1886787 [Dichotomocladium elegans]